MGSVGFDVSLYSDPLISERSVDEARPLKVIYIGAGISGIDAAIQFPKYVPEGLDLVIYDKNADVGGTWYENRYPGCACGTISKSPSCLVVQPLFPFREMTLPRVYHMIVMEAFCQSFNPSQVDQEMLKMIKLLVQVLRADDELVDIPAHSYQLSYESNVEWSQFYVGAPEILKYWQRVADKYDVRRFMKFKHECLQASWNDDTSKWHVMLQNLETGQIFEDVADVFITATGVLNDWKWPDIKGLHDFEGVLLHSAVWDQTFDAEGKTIAVIGAGSSGIQIVPTLQKKVKMMDHYVRGRTWIASTFGHELVEERNDGKDGNFTYEAAEKEKWRNDPQAYLSYRKAIEAGMQGGFAITHRDTPEHNEAWKVFKQKMATTLRKKPEVADHIIPSFPPLCKRLTPGPGYLEALTANNVNVIPEQISHVDKTGIVTIDGTRRPIDAIVCATGFNTSMLGRFPIFGRGGQSLKDRYNSRPETYLSTATDGFPNYFQSLGPNSGLGNGNLLILIESLQLYIAQVLQKLATTNIKTIEVKKAAVKNFTNYCDAFFKRTVFSAECNSWYKTSPPGTSPEMRKKGRVSALWPGSSIHAVKTLEKVRWEDYEYEYTDGNEFGWIGDGWGVAERRQDFQGLTWYLDGSRFLHHELPNSNDQKHETGTGSEIE